MDQFAIGMGKENNAILLDCNTLKYNYCPIELKDEILNKLASIISPIDNPILIEGHTDNRSINTSKYPSNWELSTDRAVNVVRYFVEVMGQEPKRFSAIGYGEFQPVASNDTYENMSKNRRVDILIVTADKEEN